MKEVTRSPTDPAAEPSAKLGRAEKKAVQRQRILDAARHVFFRDGFMDANLDEVAQIAGVAKGTLYRYFENKAELYVAILSHNGDLFRERMREAAQQGETPRERIRSLGRFYYRHWTRNPEYFQIFWALENESVIGELPRGVVAEVTRLWEDCLEILASSIRAGIDAGAFAQCEEWVVANILWTSANGLIQSESVASRRSTLRGREPEEVFEAMIGLVLGGLAAR